MKYSFFETRPHMRDTLISDDYIFTGQELLGSVSFNESVNVGEELNIGSCIISSIGFELSNMNSLIDNLTGKEFVWKMAAQTDENSFAQLARAARSKLICINGEVAYVVSERAPWLSIWDVSNRLKLGDVQQQPSNAIKGLAVVGNKLYCLHGEFPFLTAYSITGNDLFPVTPPILNTFKKGKLKELCARRYSCNLQGNILKEYRIEMYDQKPRNLLESTFEYVQMGIFIAERPTKINETKIKISCMDRISLFEKYIDEWLAQVKYPISLKAYLVSLCRYIGVDFVDSSFLNQDYVVQKNYRAQNITGTQVLRYIAEVAACFGRMDTDGKLRLGWYTATGYSIDNSAYDSLTIEDYVTAPIDKLQVRVVENDIGVIVPADDPSKTNVYIIENNPLLYAETDAELRPTAQKIFDAIKNISYRPYSAKISVNPLLRAGDIVTAVDKAGNNFSGYIMSRSLSGRMDTIEAVGGERREQQSSAVNQQIQQLRGTVHEVVNTIEELRSDITNYQEQTDGTIKILSTSISQNAKDITLKASQSSVDALGQRVTTAEASIKVNTNAIALKASQSEVNAIGTRLSSAESSITLNTNTINTKVSQTDYDANNTAINTHFSSLDQTVGGFKLAVDNHKLTFDANGLTIQNGGFKILNGTENIFSIASDGSGIEMKGNIKSEIRDGDYLFGVEIKNSQIRFTQNGSISGIISSNVYNGSKYITIIGTILSITAWEITTDSLSVSNSKILKSTMYVNGVKHQYLSWGDL